MTRSQMSTQKGPRVTMRRRCDGCVYEKSESYRCQGDSGHNVSCTHPDFDEPKHIGDTTWKTPDWCPYPPPILAPRILDEIRERVEWLDVDQPGEGAEIKRAVADIIDEYRETP